MKEIRFTIVIEVPTDTDPGEVLSELSGYLPEALAGPTWRYASVEVDEGGGGPVPRLEGDNIVKSWRYSGPGGAPR